jgi:hypothetical protein
MTNERETTPMAALLANDWGSRSQVRTLVLVAATAFGIYLCYPLRVPSGVGGEPRPQAKPSSAATT